MNRYGHCNLALLGKFNGITEQVNQNLTQASRVGFNLLGNRLRNVKFKANVFIVGAYYQQLI